MPPMKGAFEGQGRVCDNCMMFVAPEGSCVIHKRTQNIRATQVCGYHVGGSPLSKWVDHPNIQSLTPDVTGLIEAPKGGTSCGGCRFFAAGECRRVADPHDKEKNASVDPMGCCALWEKAQVIPVERLTKKSGALTPNLTRLSTWAKRLKKYPVEHINAANQAVMGFTPKALPTAAHAVSSAAPVAVSVAKKKTPTQALSALALPRHLAKTNPAQAIQAGRQFGAPVVGSASVLDQLSRTSFDKLSKRAT